MLLQPESRRVVFVRVHCQQFAPHMGFNRAVWPLIESKFTPDIILGVRQFVIFVGFLNVDHHRALRRKRIPNALPVRHVQLVNDQIDISRYVTTQVSNHRHIFGRIQTKRADRDTRRREVEFRFISSLRHDFTK